MTEVVLAVCILDDKVLITRRLQNNKVLGGYWEFPGGKLEKGETHQQAIVREMKEELSIDVAVDDSSLHKPWPIIEYQYDHDFVRLVPLAIKWLGGEIRDLEVQEHRWVSACELKKIKLPAANQSLKKAVLVHLLQEK